MTRIRTAPSPQNVIVTVFLFLVAVVLAVAPVPVVLSSIGILLAAILTFSTAGTAASYLVALVAPLAGLITGDDAWLVMLPIMLSSNLLALLGLEFGWRYAALALTPVLAITPPLVVSTLGQQRLFSVSLPWEPAASSWILLHALTAVAGVLVTLYVDRRRARPAARSE